MSKISNEFSENIQNFPKFKLISSSIDFESQESEKALIRQLENETKKIQEWSSEYFQSILNEMSNDAERAQQAVLNEECSAVQTEISRIEKENLQWGRGYEEDFEALEEFYHKRRLNLEEYTMKVKEELVSIQQEELVLESELDKVCSQNELIEMEKSKIRQQQSMFSLPTATDILVYIIFILLILWIIPLG